MSMAATFLIARTSLSYSWNEAGRSESGTTALPAQVGVGHDRQRVVPAAGEGDHLARGDDATEQGDDGLDGDAVVQQLSLGRKWLAFR